jgi:antitoxin (DNA-binding transcriptional repressor) of toxin-antitoxin stability system
MNRITDMKLLAGQVKTISITELRSRPGDVITQVQMGRTFKIKKGGKIVAVLCSPEPDAFELGAEYRRVYEPKKP